MLVNVHRVGDVAVCRVSGTPTPADVIAALKTARRLGARYDIWDLGDAVLTGWDDATIERLSGEINGHVAERAALVVPNEVAESLGTRIASQLDADGVPVAVSIFTEESDAMAWLRRLHRRVQ